MLKSAQFVVLRGAAKRHVWVCLLLPALLLCNPFLAASDSPGPLAIHHPPSYRATVASSELQKFKNPESHEPMVVVDHDALEAFSVLLPRWHSSAECLDTEAPFLPDQFLSGNLWFRPPPAG
jgi:hypothetical protein